MIEYFTLVCCLRWNGIGGRNDDGGRIEEMVSRESRHPFIVYFHLGKIVASLSCFQTSCTMDQNLARLQNPHRFLRENRFLEGEDPSKGLFYDV